MGWGRGGLVRPNLAHLGPQVYQGVVGSAFTTWHALSSWCVHEENVVNGAKQQLPLMQDTALDGRSCVSAYKFNVSLV